MNVRQTITYITAVYAFLIVIDLVWIGLVAMPAYEQALGTMLRSQPVVWSAVLAWVLIPLGILLFTVPKSKTLRQSFVNGALYGLILYGVYDFTNHAILAQYSLTITLVDVLWGTFLCSITSGFSWWLKQKL